MEQLNSKLALSRRSSQPLAIIMADIDFFKHINDNHGHQAGDEVLKEIPHRMQVSSRNSDSFGRYGGEEFLFVLFPCTMAEVAFAAERFRSSVSQQAFTVHSKGTQNIQVAISAGCACTDGQTDISADGLLKQADDALYQAKAKGRNQVALAS
jgi:diguanylate cyclase (GGDEF)-like protein